MDEERIVNVEETETVPEEGKKKSVQREILEWIVVILAAFIIAQLINNFVFRFARVDGPSMEHTLHDKDYLLVWKLGYEPQCGDIIVFETDMNVQGQIKKQYLVKRVIATEGQTVEVNYDTDEVFVDGKLIKEDYIKEPDMSSFTDQQVYPLTVPDNYIYVMGDNRNNSFDSRAKGAIPVSEITGKVVFRLLPFNAIGTLK
ncbi:MAG: signal peptidase I [Clostridia bacterium]|nr:signal peptidase I [Clostridia bacterium]